MIFYGWRNNGDDKVVECRVDQRLLHDALGLRARAISTQSGLLQPPHLLAGIGADWAGRAVELCVRRGKLCEPWWEDARTAPVLWDTVIADELVTFVTRHIPPGVRSTREDLAALMLLLEERRVRA